MRTRARTAALFSPCLSTARLGFLFKSKLPSVRRVHADDAALAMVVSSSVG